MTDQIKIQQYLDLMIEEPSDVMRFIRESENLRGDICPSVGKEIGNLLYFLTVITNSRKILEIGTSIGYSTSWLAFAARQTEGHVDTIEVSTRLIDEAIANIKLQKLYDIVSFHNDLGEKAINDFNYEFDLIFIDGSTKSYGELFDLCINKLRKGGLLVFEDILFSVSGKRNIQKDMMNKFNLKVKNDKRVQCSYLNIGDGLLLCQKR